MLVDTHCHLDFNSFDKDRDQVIARAREAGVERLLNPGINLESSTVAVKLSEKYPEVYAAVGFHPNDGLSWESDSVSQLRKLATHKKVVAIGEIGLDFYRDRTPRELQVQIFKEQLNLAAELNLPVVIHSRKAMAEVLEIFEEWRGNLDRSQSRMADYPGVLHSFSGDVQLADRTRALNFFIGITGPVTFRNAGDLQDLVIRLPLQELLIETDAPFLSPHPHRGKRNEPAKVKLVAEKIAELHQEAYNIVAEITTANAARLYGW
ncbi:MAG: TatD family hydrolase [Chloroflexi bacterium]|nr:TatD family hydrolase [Chloroflexota bacterium]